MRRLARSERVSAGLLLGAAVLGLVLANTTAGPALLAAKGAHPGAVGALDLSLGHWVSDGLLAVFFLIVAIELKHELVNGALNSPSRALRPAIAAAGGVIVPALVYLAVTAGSGYAQGWPVPTATDIAFALGVLGILGRGLPPTIRVFLLALAIIDDLVAIVIIAVFFTTDPQLAPLALAAVGVAVFAVLSRLLGTRARPLVMVAMLAVGLATWYLVAVSGVHATIAGVALGLAMRLRSGMHLRHHLEPFSNLGILPLFAFTAALVPLPSVSVAQLSAPFWGILVALPVGKLVGITLGALLAMRVGRTERLPLGSIVTVAALGGIGFTVSLLMNELAFARSEEVVAEGTLAVLLGSGIAMVVSGVLVTLQARRHRAARS